MLLYTVKFQKRIITKHFVLSCAKFIWGSVKLKFSKSVLTIMLAASLAVSASSYSESCIAYAIENAALQTDFSEAETLKITDDTVLKLPVGQALTYSTITVSAGKTLTVKGGGSLVADKITGGNLLINSGTVSANNVSSAVKLVNGSLCTSESTGAVTVNGGSFQTDSLKSSLTVYEGSVNIGTYSASASNINIKGGTVELGSAVCGSLYVSGGSLDYASKIDNNSEMSEDADESGLKIKAYNYVNIIGGSVTADSIDGGAIYFNGGVTETKSISGNDGGPVIIKNGNIKTDTLKGGDGISSSESYTISDTTYNKNAGGSIIISDGIVEIGQELRAGNMVGNTGGEISITGGKVTVNGNVTAGDAPDYTSNVSGGSVTISQNADVVINGNIKSGNGSNSDTSKYHANGGKGGNVHISGGTIKGNITCGKGGVSGLTRYYVNGYTHKAEVTYSYGGNGGSILIDGGDISGELIAGDGGRGMSYYNSDFGGYLSSVSGDMGSVKINGGKIKMLKCSGTLTSSSDGTAVITASSVPSLTSFTSGVIKMSGDILVYGSQTFASDEYLDEYDTLTVKKNGRLNVSGCTLKADGEINNGGSIIIGADGQLDGSGTYIYNNETTAIPELRAKLAKEMITIPEGMVYSGADLKSSITMEPKEAYGITFENMSLSDADITFTYSETSDGEQNKTDIIKDAGYYSAFINGSSDGIPFEVSRKEISVGAVNALEDKSGITEITFEGLAGDETLEYGKDYTVSGIEWGENSVSGVITLLDTRDAKNNSVSENGTFNCDNVNYEHVHNMVWKYDGEQHWKECVCGEKTDVGAHTRNEGVTKQEPSETTDEIIVYSCTECGYVMEEQTIHNFFGDWKSDENGHWQVCRCGERSEVYPHGNDDAYEGVITSEPTEEKDGVRTFYCKECGYAYRTEPVKYEHVHAAYGEWLSDETYHWHGCKCGEEGVIFDKEEHTPDSGTIIKEANETENGVIRYYCSVCGAQMNDEEISVTVIGAVVSSNRVIATYKDTVGSEPYTIEYAFGDVPEKLVEYMYSTDIQLVIDFVNNFSTAESGDHMILTPAQMKSVEYVIGYDNLNS